MERCLVLVSLLLAAACSGGGTADSPAMCATRADSIGKKLRLLVRDAPLISTATSPIPTSKIGLDPHVRGPVIGIAGNLVTYNGQRIEPNAQLIASRVEKERKRHAVYARSSVLPLYVHADPATPLARVTNLVGRAEHAFRLLVQQQRVGRADPMASAPARVRKMVASIKSMRASESASQLAKRMEKAIGTCPSVIELFGEVAVADAARKSALIAEQIAMRLRRCNCQLADIDAFEYLLIAVVDVGDTIQRYVPVSLVGKGAPVQMAGSKTVADLVTRLESLPNANKGVALRVK